MNITWKPVASKGVTLLIGSDGSVKSPEHTCTYTRIRNGETQTFESIFSEKIISPYTTKGGYLEVSISINGERKKHAVHRLVGMAFVDGYRGGLCINHIDGNKKNNHPSNLEWVSIARNTQHAWETGLVDLNGEKHPSSKLTSKQVVYIRKLLNSGISAHTLSVIAAVSPSMIDKIRSGDRWKSAL